MQSLFDRIKFHHANRLNPNTTYYLSVQSVNEGGVSEYLSIGRMVTLAAAPGLSLDLNGPNSIRIVIDPKGNP
jgi:hypothetical protein